MRKFNTWRKSTPDMKQHFNEACRELFIARYTLLTKPFKKIAPELGQLDQLGPEHDLHDDEIAIIRPVAKSIKAVAAVVPWQSKCLVQAMAAKQMLARRGVDTTLYLGVLKEGSDMKAHAWLRCGPLFITGGNGERTYTIVRTFYSQPDTTPC
ncbi:MAG: lasso peptide biosynthesis B2 protein [Coxiellaceae bacterium]|nr:lasso peptide biosynthesis B2 protein [Coxiellaceae bacterium]